MTKTWASNTKVVLPAAVKPANLEHYLHDKSFYMPLTKIDEYEVMYSANTFSPGIWLKSAGKYMGQLIFRPDGSVLPPDDIVAGRVYLYYHLQQYAHCIDLLRNEKPMYLMYSGSGGGFENGIKTTPEPVGEAE